MTQSAAATDSHDSIFADRLRQFGGTRALLLESDVSITYEELADRVDAVAAQLGPQRSLVLVHAALSLESIVSYLAALAGCHPVILTTPEQTGASGEVVEALGVDVTVAADGAIRHTGKSRRQTLHQDLAVLLSTSGSTGGAKHVRLSRRNVESNAAAIVEYLRITPGDVGAMTLPLHYSYGFSVLNSHLFAGAALCVSPRPITDPTLLDWFDEVGCTNISGVPYSYEVFERIGLRNHRLHGLRFMTAAGGRLPPTIVRQYADYLDTRGGRFFAMYGQTEASPRIAYLPPEAALDHPDCIGVAIPGGELFLIDADGKRIAATGTPGELVYRGPNVMMGYATTAADLAGPAGLDELRTGDLAERTAEGFLRIVGRMSRFSKLSGFRVSHDDVERRLNGIGIAAAVTGDDARLVVAVTGSQSADDVARGIMEFSSLTRAQIRVLSLTEVPRLNTGKVDYRSVSQLATEDGPAVPGSVLESFTRAFWPRPVRATDSFVSLGGDSLTYVGLAVALERVLGQLPGDWERTRIADLAAAPPESSRWSLVDPSVCIRAAAILSVVVHHLSGWGGRGGAFILMTMVGYSLARFQSQALFDGNAAAVGRQLLRNILLYAVVLVCWLMLNGVFRWPDLLLLSNVIASPHSPVAYNAYWFVEAYAHIVGAVVLVCLVPAIRGAIARHPLGTGLAALAACLAVPFAGRLTWDYSWNACTQMACMPTTEVAYWAAIGWCLNFADTPFKRRGLLLVAVAVVSGISYGLYSGLPGGLVFIVAAFWLLAWRLRIRLPSKVAAVASYVAANSYVIYLLHLVPMILITEHAGWWGILNSGPLARLMSIALGLAFPLAVASAFRILTGFYRKERGVSPI